MVMSVTARRFNVAMLLVTVLTLLFNFKGYVGNAVLLKLITYKMLYFVGFALCDNVHGSIIALTVKGPDVDVVNV